MTFKTMKIYNIPRISVHRSTNHQRLGFFELELMVRERQDGTNTI